MTVRLNQFRRSLHALHSSPAAETDVPTLTIEESGTTEKTRTITLNTPAERAEYAKRAKARVLQLIPELTDDSEGHERVRLLINGLEKVHGYQPIMTAGFLDLLMSGEWKLVYTTSRRRSGSRLLRMTELAQIVEPASVNGEQEDGGDSGGVPSEVPKGRVRSVAAWDWAGEASGVFEVQAAYKMDTRGGMVMPTEEEEVEYVLDPKAGSLSDPLPLCASLEAAMPPELFSPHVFSLQRNIYLDPEMRIVEFQKEDGMGARGVFVRASGLAV